MRRDAQRRARQELRGSSTLAAPADETHDANHYGLAYAAGEHDRVGLEGLGEVPVHLDLVGRAPSCAGPHGGTARRVYGDCMPRSSHRPLGASWTVPALLLAGVTAQSAAVPASAAVDFTRDVRPILAGHCFACHGPDGGARKADLRLDRREDALAARDGGASIVPGDPDASALWQRVASDDPDEVMPPPKAHKPLTAAQRATLRAWIAAGAPYAAHWAFVPPRPAAVPALPPADAPTPIDAFVRAPLRARGLGWNAEADRATLLRRLSFDLTGLPPTADEVAAFVADPATDAYERAVDRLLASPHCAERLALPWLDASRYADTNGFSIDGGRHLWLWRDWVIAAFAANKPFDRFLVEQLAGDLLPAADDAMRTATGFQRNAMITHEGGTIAAENLVTYGADRTKTFGEAVLGLTVGCAQCHDHKYDPISQREYYGLFAFFNQTSEPAHGGDGGNNAPPAIDAQSVLATGEEDALRARIAALEAQLAAPAPELVAAWVAEQRLRLAARGVGLGLHACTPTAITTPNTGSGYRIVENRFAVVDRPMSGLAFDVAMELPRTEAPITGLRVVMHADPQQPQEGWGWGGGAGGKRTFALTCLSLSAGTVPSPQVNLYDAMPIARVTASSWQESDDGRDRPEGALDTPARSGWMPDLAADGPVHLTATFAMPLPPDASCLTAQLHFGRYGDLTAKRMEFFAVTGSDDGTDLPPVIVTLVQAEAPLPPEQQRELAAYVARRAPVFEPLRVDLQNARERLAVRTQKFSTMVMDVAANPRPTHVLHRGAYDQPREQVAAGVPTALPPLPAGAGADRLALARWVVDPGHPLTARVAVNRFWQMLFGHGLVRTPADFGTQGEAPTHPELLDWLAVDFVQHGWDVRRLLRQIVTSAAYRQSAVVDDAVRARDPDNRLLARGPRHRLPAEFVRDAALATSGLLVRQLGGPSVNPYTPGDPWREISHFGSSPATAQAFVQDHGEKLWRRSLYTYWKRTLPPPNMALFDAPNREVCVVDRANTNTPLQALALLNDVTFVEAARAFAERIWRRASDDDARLRWAFAEATSRTADAAELVVLRRALQRERVRYAADRDAAARLLAHGESPRSADVPPAEHAAWTQVATLLLNLTDAVTKP